MNRVLAGVAVFAVVIAVIVGLSLRSREPAPVAAAGAPAPAAAPVTPPTPPTPPPAPPAARPPAEAAAVPPELRFQRLDIDATKAAAEACLVFSRSLDPAAHYDEYLVFVPELRPAMRVDGKSLCLAGMAFGVTYQAEMRAGLPAADGLKLLAAQKIEVALRDRPPLLAFRDGLILPRENAAGVPIISINIDRIAIKLFRVPERLISQIGADTMAQRQAWTYDVTQLEDERGALLWQGEMEVKAARNETATTLFPLHDVLKDRKPGVYVVIADDAAQKLKQPDNDEDSGLERRRAAQWVIDSDIALTSFEGADGLHVFARSLSHAAPIAGLALTLVARDNDELAKVTTDADGQAHFDPA